MRTQLLAARTAFAALLLAVLTAAGAVAGVRLGHFGFDTGSLVMIPATLLGGVALLAACLWFRQAFARNAGEGKRMGLVALFGAMAFLYPPLHHVLTGFTQPAIHDASSDPEDPPPFVALLKTRTANMNSPVFDGQSRIRYKGEDMTIAHVIHEYENGIVTKPRAKLMPNTPDPVKTLFWRCFQAVKTLGWTVVDFNETEGRIEATTRSFWFGEVSDIVIRVRPSGGIGARPDIRAASRTVKQDHGHNLALLKAFFAKL